MMMGLPGSDIPWGSLAQHGTKIRRTLERYGPMAAKTKGNGSHHLPPAHCTIRLVITETLYGTVYVDEATNS